MAAYLQAPEPQLKVLRGLGCEIQGALLAILVSVDVHKRERARVKLRVQIALECLCPLSCQNLQAGIC